MVKYTVYLIIGWIGVVFAVVAAVLPIIPMTPFLFLAAFGFSKSSKRFHKWICDLPKIGPLIIQWERYRILNRSTKWVLSTFFVPVIVLAIIRLDYLSALAILLVVVGVLAYIWSRNEHQTDLG